MIADLISSPASLDAYASGDHIVLGDRCQQLHIGAHEAAHMVQPRAGVSHSGGPGEAGGPYELHVDADLVVQGESAEGMLGEMAGNWTSNSLQLKPSDESATTQTTQTETTRTEASEEADSEESEETLVRLALSQRLAELESCASEAEFADLLHDVGREVGCSPRIVRMSWRQTEAEVAWRGRTGSGRVERHRHATRGGDG